jgi:two-component system chemotaxis sensor kinase CheA
MRPSKPTTTCAKNAEVAWDKAHLLEQLKETFSALQEYAKVNEVKLGRKGPGRRGGVDKFLMVQKDHIESLIDTLEQPDAKSEAVKDDLFRRVLGTLKQIGTEKIGDILAGVTDSLPSLAKELGKEPPVVVIHDEGIVVRNQIADLLKNTFMHLLRNSMDHGIETQKSGWRRASRPSEKLNWTCRSPAADCGSSCTMTEGDWPWV